jgi:NRAMP (natural resistance-associated macrophage protein)-like metal ion transporter
MAKKKNDFIKRGAEMPSIALEQAAATGQRVATQLPKAKALKRTKAYWHVLGPGLTSGASGNDPSGIATYSQSGAQNGFQYLWLSVWTLPLIVTVQEMCARIGLVTGRGLAGNIRIFFSRRMLMFCTLLLFAANCFNIGADLGAMAAATQLLFPKFDFYALVAFFSVISLLLMIFMPYVKYARYLKWLALVMLSYILSAILAHLNWHDVLQHAYRPSISFNKDEILIVVAALGTTISPYMFFWQTSQEVEQEILNGKKTVKMRSSATTPAEIRTMRIDVWSGMFLGNLVMFFIIAACGGILYPHGIRDIQTAAQAADALKPFAGDASSFLFAVGIIGTGLLAIPVLAASSSYALAESFRWREGLYRNLAQARAFYGVIIISMGVGLGINFVGIDPIKALIYAALGNAIVAPLVLYLIVRISSNKKFMGKWVNKPWTKLIGYVTVACMTIAAITAIYSLVS